MGYGAAAHVSFVYMLYHMDVIRVPKEETFSKKHTAEEVRLLTIVAGIFLHFFLVRHETQLFHNERLRKVVVSDSNYQNCLMVKSSNVRSNKPMQHFT